MKLKQYLIEIKQVSKDVKTKVTKNTKDAYGANINVAGNEFEFSADFNDIEEIALNIDDGLADALEENGYDGSWEVSFVDKEGEDINPKEKGVSLKIFAAVIEQVEKFIKSKKPKSVFFTAKSNEPSKVKLYELLAKKLSKVGGYKTVPFKISGYKGWLFHKG